jgi:hypothetical protein
MKYVDKLTDEELTDIFKSFMTPDEELVSLEITRFDNDIDLIGIVRFPDDEEPGEMIEVEDNYELTDYNVRVYTHSGNMTKRYREFMFRKFGNQYAKDYLFTE